MFSFFSGIRRYTYNSALFYNMRIFLALIGTTAIPWWLNEPRQTIPLVLGVVAAALTDLDDRLVGRLRNLLITLLCFFIASVSVELLFPYPWLFAAGLLFSTTGFILLGSWGQRYATIAFGALLIAIYTMLGESMYQVWYHQPLLLLAGAVWYNILTLLGHVLFPIRPVQQNLSRCYIQLALYLDAKSNLFDLDQEGNFKQTLIDLAMVNSTLVTTLNQTKASLLTRLKGDRGQRGTRRTLHYYFVAQDIHERASSSHFQYAQLHQAFCHSDVLFRFQRLLMLQAQACQHLSRSILLHQKYQHDPRFERAFTHLDATLQRISNQVDVENALVKSLFNLLANLKAIDAQLANIESEQILTGIKAGENVLAEDHPNGWNDMILRLRRQLTPKSALFRHAVRMSLVLVTGYALIQFTGLTHGYWILLTSLFVCQPNYNATKHRLALRIVGTLAGVLLGLPVLYFVPSLEGQLLLIVISGVLFFAFRNVQYAHATMFITLLVMLCFNLLGEGFEVVVPRIYDTLIGCAIAWGAVTFIWPDWKFRQLPTVIAKTFNANCRYLDAIMGQYHQGKSNGLDYRIARREAHNCDAELATMVSNMSVEPKTDAATQAAAFRLLCLNHTLLSYISALGAHREILSDTVTLNILNDVVCYIDGALNYNNDVTQQMENATTHLWERIVEHAPYEESKAQVVMQQAGLMMEILPELVCLKNELSLSASTS